MIISLFLTQLNIRYKYITPVQPAVYGRKGMLYLTTKSTHSMASKQITGDMSKDTYPDQNNNLQFTQGF